MSINRITLLFWGGGCLLSCTRYQILAGVTVKELSSFTKPSVHENIAFLLVIYTKLRREMECAFNLDEEKISSAISFQCRKSFLT